MSCFENQRTWVGVYEDFGGGIGGGMEYHSGDRYGNVWWEVRDRAVLENTGPVPCTDLMFWPLNHNPSS